MQSGTIPRATEINGKTLHTSLKTGSDLPKLIQKNNDYSQEGVHRPFRSDVGSTVG